MGNLLHDEIQYRTDHSRFGTWRRYLYPNGRLFAEFRSHARLLGLPLVHYTRGICPETGRRVVAKGVVAVGRLAVGGLAVGQAAAGVLAVGQLGVGLVLGLGQAGAGLAAVGQIALGWEFGLGQVATGELAVGQLAAGTHVLAQVGVGEHVWDQRGADPQAQAFFHSLWDDLRARLGWD